MNREEALAADYRCPKCRGQQCRFEHVNLPHGRLPIHTGRYLAVTCHLCGYTEFYDQAVSESAEEPTGDEEIAPEGT
ncbi:hypothetical protein KQI84_04420 [bacterium]|nr:hypothetical protein [bacterium]